jgi:streptomycin 3"-adenylyltransferase
VYGKPINEVFAEIPRKYYLASVALDSEDSFKNIQEKTGTEKCIVPNYAVINFCRVLAFIDEGIITSKAEGGEWALKNLPEKYRPVISAALQEYRKTGSSKKIEPNILKDFSLYAQNRIREAVSSS